MTLQNVHLIIFALMMYLFAFDGHTSATFERTSLKFESIEPDKFSTIGEIKAIQEDHDGFMWFAGANGLARYDGYDVRIYVHRDEDLTSLSTNSTNDIILDKQRGLWIATYWGLNYYDPELDNFRTFLKHETPSLGPSHNGIICLQQTQDGAIWIGTQGGGLNRFDPNTHTFQHFDTSNSELSGDNISVVFQDSRGFLWVGYLGQGASRFRIEASGNLTEGKHFNKEKGTLSNDQIITINEDRHGNIWLGSIQGLIRINQDLSKNQVYHRNTKDPHQIHGTSTRDLLLDDEGTLWLVDSADSIYRRREDIDGFERYTPNLPSKAHRIYKDSAGTLWLGTIPSGVAKVNRYASAFTNFIAEDEIHRKTYSSSPSKPDWTPYLSHSNITALAKDSQDNLWVGTAYGINYLDLNAMLIKQYIPIQDPKAAHRGSSVEGVALTDDNNIWFGNSWWGLTHFDLKNDHKERFVHQKNNENSLKNSEIWSTYTDSADNLWIGTHRGWLHRYRTETHDFERIQLNTDYNANRIMAIASGDDNSLWLGTDNGLYHATPRDNKWYIERHDKNTSSKLLPDNESILSITQDSQHNMWFGTNGGGVYFWNPKTEEFKVYMEKDGLAGNIVTKILEDDEGNMWFATTHGLSNLNIKSDRFRNYVKKDGLAGTTHQRSAGVKLASGELVFGSTSGLTLFNPKNIYINSTPPRVVITEFWLFNKPLAPGELHPSSDAPLLDKTIANTKKLILNHKQSVFSFKFSALDFNAPQKNQYRYQLIGFDENWIESGGKRTATYTNLDPGRYQFHVQASNNEGIWNRQGSTIDIVILPPWWKTWWAYTSYILIMTGLIARAIYVQYTKRQQAEKLNIILETKVAERTEELKQKNDDIQAMLQNMHQGLFTIQRNGKIHREYSEYLKSIFETNKITDVKYSELLFSHSDLDTETIDKITNTVEASIGENEFNFVVNQHLLINEYTITINGKQKHIEIDWNPIINDGEVLRLMVTVRNVTVIKQLQQEAKSHQRELDIIESLLEISNSQFNRFTQSTELLIEDNIKSLSRYREHAIPFTEVIDRLMGNYHTIKGNARTYYLDEFSQLTHKYESVLEEVKKTQLKNLTKEEIPNHLAELNRQQQELTQLLNEYTHIYHEVFGRSQHINQCSKQNDSINQALKSDDIKQIKKILLECQSLTLEESIEDTLSSLDSLASELGKPSPKVLFSGPAIKFKPHARPLLQNIFSHILRNNLDHGIEESSMRRQAGKPEYGRIDISVDTEDDLVIISVYDDGQGLNMASLRKAAIHNQLWPEDYQPTASELADSILASGTSTKETVSRISGRGVGMDAVKQFIEEHGGQIKILLTDPTLDQIEGSATFKIVIKLPIDLSISQKLETTG